MDVVTFANGLNTKYFEGQLSDSFIERLSGLPIDRPDVYAFIERMFKLMSQSGYPAHDLSTLQGDILGSLLARILPGAWEGRIPPITVAGRHKVIDNYLKHTQWLDNGPKRMLDLGCGFPPSTTVETANVFTDWMIIGADPSLPVYLVYDEDGNYCTFDETKTPVYFQPAIPSIENWNALLSDAPSTRERFQQLLNKLLAEDRAYADDALPRLRIDPVHSHSTSNLSFITGGIGQLDIEPVDVIRCFNVMFYFDDAFRQRSMKWFESILSEGGLLVIGANWALSTESRYTVYQKVNGQLVHREYAFSLDNFSPIGIVTWYALHDDDRDAAALAKYLRVLRNDDDFTGSFYEFMDHQRQLTGICPRDSTGYYGDLVSNLDPVRLWTEVGGMVDALGASQVARKAIDAFTRAGHKAWHNEVGHISISGS